VGTERRGCGEDSILFDHMGTACRDSKYHRHCQDGSRGVISNGYWPDGRVMGAPARSPFLPAERRLVWSLRSGPVVSGTVA
jgi:hypothetical protein